MTEIISSPRLDLIPLTPAFLSACLADEREAAETILGLSIPPEWFEEKGLMQLRLAQLEQRPDLQPWLLRAMGLRSQKQMVGHIGFHSAPGTSYLDEIAPGGVEYGYTVFSAYRRQGYAREACTALMRWARQGQQTPWAAQEQGAPCFVVSIRPDNEPSLRLAQGFGFEKAGSHTDEVDGVEDIFVLRAGAQTYLDFTLRRARREDVAAIVRLLADDPLGRKREQAEEPLPDSYYTAFEAIDGEANNELLVAEMDGKVIGTMHLTFLQYLSFQGGKRLLVESLHVDSAYRGQGIGGQMMAWVIERAREAGCCQVQLTSSNSRVEAHRFYERMGFVASHVGMKLWLGQPVWAREGFG